MNNNSTLYTSATFEREKTHEEALALFENEMQNLNLSYSLKYTGNFYPSTTCYLYQDHKLVDVGHGKGLELQSEISAKYEALEHYLISRGSKIEYDKNISSLNAFRNELNDKNREYLDYFINIQNFDKKTLWVNLKKMSDKSGFLKVPYFLINPDYYRTPHLLDELDYSLLPIKCMNSGSSTGATLEEAMLHAVNEIIERDALSCFLLATFAKKIPRKLRVINKSSLPPKLKELVLMIESIYNELLLIVDISSDLNFPTFCVTFTQQKQKIQPQGFGTSICAAYALERAILEALQIFHLYQNNPLDFDLKKEDERILEGFRKWPILKSCAMCDLQSIDNIVVDFVSMSNFQSLDSKSSVNALLNYTVEILQNRGFQLYYCEHSDHSMGVKCVRVIIPGLEFFHMVRYGKFILPGSRGKNILNRPLA